MMKTIRTDQKDRTKRMVRSYTVSPAMASSSLHYISKVPGEPVLF